MSPTLLSITDTFDDHKGNHDEQADTNDKSKRKQIREEILREIRSDNNVVSLVVHKLVLESHSIFIGNEYRRDSFE